MGRKKVVKNMETAMATKPVRLDLDPDAHRMLRVVAAEEGKPMAVYARDIVVQAVARRYAELRGDR